MNWLEHTTTEEKTAILASVSHSLDYWDFTLDSAIIDAGDLLLDDLDNAVNQINISGLAKHLDEPTLHTLWATLYAFIRDIHQPQYNMASEHWAIAEEIFDHLNALLANEPAAVAP